MEQRCSFQTDARFETQLLPCCLGKSCVSFCPRDYSAEAQVNPSGIPSRTRSIRPEQFDMLKRELTLRKVEILLEVARLKSIKLAAENLGVSQPSVSMFLSRLEQVTQVRIFAKRGQTFSLSPQGVEVVDRLQVIYDEFSKLDPVTDKEKTVVMNM